MSWAEHAWTPERLAGGIVALARSAGLVSRDAAAVSPSPSLGSPSLDAWFERLGAGVGVRIEPVAMPYAAMDRMLTLAAPAILRVHVRGAERFLLLSGRRLGRLRLLGPDLGQKLVGRAEVAEAFAARLVATAPTDIDGCLREAGIPPRKHGRARRALLLECLRGASVDGCWLLRPSRHAEWTVAMRRERAPRRLASFALTYLGQLGCRGLAWGALGMIAFAPTPSTEWLWPLAGLLLLAMPLQMATGWNAGLVALSLGSRLKQRLLAGALALPAEVLRSAAVGQHLGRIIESEAFEAALLAGAAAGGAAAIDLAAAGAMLWAGAGGPPHAGLLALWTLLGCALLAGYYFRRRRWSGDRLALTHRLVERIVGHQTRLAQQSAAAWHVPEDAELDSYHAASKGMDRWQIWISALAVRGWLPVGLLGLAPAFVRDDATHGGLAVGLGAVLLAQAAFAQFANSMSMMIDALIAWRLVSPLSSAAASGEPPASTEAPPSSADGPSTGDGRQPAGTMLLEAQELGLRYAERDHAVFEKCDLAIRAGDRILLQGSSGSGKSSLVSVLAGLLPPSQGLLLLRGLDRQTLGARCWRRLVALAPQFHANHLVTGTLAFNLLMGRRWPPSGTDLADATAICRELGLGSLLSRMPNGLHQVVGETGWQLSHGERSRIYLARAVLQQADLLILDESFAALDAPTLQACMTVLLERQETLLVVAHP